MNANYRKCDDSERKYDAILSINRHKMMKITLYKMNIEIFRTEKKDNGETIESKSKKNHDTLSIRGPI